MIPRVWIVYFYFTFAISSQTHIHPILTQTLIYVNLLHRSQISSYHCSIPSVHLFIDLPLPLFVFLKSFTVSTLLFLINIIELSLSCPSKHISILHLDVINLVLRLQISSCHCSVSSIHFFIRYPFPLSLHHFFSSTSSNHLSFDFPSQSMKIQDTLSCIHVSCSILSNHFARFSKQFFSNCAYPLSTIPINIANLTTTL